MSERKYTYSPDSVFQNKQVDVFFPNIKISDPELISLREVHKTFQFNLRDSDVLTSLFAQPEISKFKIAELREFGKCRTLVKDEFNNSYWAELLLLRDGTVEVCDINAQEEFLIDGEDILEELERNPGKTVSYSVSLC